MFGWFRSGARKRRMNVDLDRKHLEKRARRFLTGYLEANETRKPHCKQECQAAEMDLASPDADDRRIAEASSETAMNGFGSNCAGA